MRNIYLIAYDIRHPVRLRRMAKVVKNYGQRLQKSIFEAELTEPELKGMMEQMRTIINPDEDGVKIFKLCQACESRRSGAGLHSPLLPDKPWHIF